MFDPSVHGPLSVTASDRDWAADLLAQIAGNEDRRAFVDPVAPFDKLEQQALQLGLTEGERPTPRGAQSNPLARVLERLSEWFFGRRVGNALANPRLEALRRFSAATRRQHGVADNAELSRFLEAGFSLQHALEIAICAVATTIGRVDRAAIDTRRCGLLRGIA